MKLLNEIQQKLKAPKGQKNTFGNYNYRSCEDILEAVKPLIGERGTLTFQDEIMVFPVEGTIVTTNKDIKKNTETITSQPATRVYLKTTATLNDGKESVSAIAFARESFDKKGMDDAQITGATSSYARKYALNGLFCIDDSRDPDNPPNGKPKPEPKTPLEITNQAFLLWQAKYPKSKKTFKQFQADVIKISPTKKLPTTKASIPQIIDTIKPDEEDGLMGIDEVTPAPKKWVCTSCNKEAFTLPEDGECIACGGFLQEVDNGKLQ
jgi:hypothetical protein